MRVKHARYGYGNVEHVSDLKDMVTTVFFDTPLLIKRVHTRLLKKVKIKKKLHKLK